MNTCRNYTLCITLCVGVRYPFVHGPLTAAYERWCRAIVTVTDICRPTGRIVNLNASGVGDAPGVYVD